MFKYLRYFCGMVKAITIKTEVSVKELNPDSLGKNPFIESLSIPVNKIPVIGQYKVTKELAVDGKAIMIPVEIEVESEPHCKVYNDARRRKMMVVLSKPGKELFLWLIYEMEAGKDYVWVNKKRYLKENDIKSQNTYRTAVNDLIFNGYIVKTLATDVYWINPTLFFNGSRKSKFPKNVVRK